MCMTTTGGSPTPTVPTAPGSSPTSTISVPATDPSGEPLGSSPSSNPFYSSVIAAMSAAQTPKPYSTGAPDMGQLLQMLQGQQAGG